jgi:hypothetical protein
MPSNKMKPLKESILKDIDDNLEQGNIQIKKLKEIEDIRNNIKLVNDFFNIHYYANHSDKTKDIWNTKIEIGDVVFVSDGYDTDLGIVINSDGEFYTIATGIRRDSSGPTDENPFVDTFQVTASYETVVVLAKKKHAVKFLKTLMKSI